MALAKRFLRMLFCLCLCSIMGGQALEAKQKAWPMDPSHGPKPYGFCNHPYHPGHLSCRCNHHYPYHLRPFCSHSYHPGAEFCGCFHFWPKGSFYWQWGW